jgi:hypothetical protein
MITGTPAQLMSPSLAEDSFGIFDAPNMTGTPERRLLLAVLERAILDYVGNDPREIADAKAWIFEHIEDESHEEMTIVPEFSFLWICQELDLDAKLIASYIRSMPKRGKQKIAPWYFKESANKNSEAARPSKITKIIEVDFQKRNEQRRVAS